LGPREGVGREGWTGEEGEKWERWKGGEERRSEGKGGRW